MELAPRPSDDYHDGLRRRARELPRLTRSEVIRVLAAIKAQHGTAGLFLVAWQLVVDLLNWFGSAISERALADVRDPAALAFLDLIVTEQRSKVFPGAASRFFQTEVETRLDRGTSFACALVSASASVTS